MHGVITKKQPELSFNRRDSGRSVLTPTCLRCGGFLVVEHWTDLLSTAADPDSCAMRCVQCGDVIDAVILRHRQIQNRLKPSSTTAACTKMAFVGVETATGS
ncbi:hypothetical protein YTPLAS18_01010 [Nitrospira sp.]|nr:hypothetical protein YTPLAS18_01010 [Nitrospira sp.]